MKRLSRPRMLIAGLLGGVLAAAAIHVALLDAEITRQFRGRRWNLPAQVYAQPLELYAGLAMGTGELETELQRLRYRRGDRLSGSGSYRRVGGRIDVALRRVRFADELREAQRLTILTDEGRIRELLDARGTEVPIIRLDPLLIGSVFPIHGEDRVIVAPGEVPKLLPEALKAIEDRGFESHHGIQLRAIMRAAWANLRAGRVEQGGSTLTQQLVKSYFLEDARTFRRKAREAVMAVILDARFEKADIMNAYINEIYLGQDGRRAVHGFGLASRFYFGRPLDELELPQIALLVGMVRGPSYYDPRAHPARARARRDLVLARLAALGVITATEALTAAEMPLGIAPRDMTGYYPGYLDYVRRTLRRDYRETDLLEEGLQVFTNFEPRVQAAAERALERELSRLDRRAGARGSALEGAVVVTSPQNGDVLAIVGGRHVDVAGFNRALDARRPIGSLVKPVVYLTALETGRYHALSTLDDSPIEVRLRGGQVWRPRNYDETALGPIPLMRALAESRNLATVRLGLDIGIGRVTKKLGQLGLEQEPAPVPALLLGAVDLAPLQVAGIYDALANGGFRTPQRAVRSVVAPDGRELRSFPLEVMRVAEPDAVYQLDRMLVQVMQRGTGRAAAARLPASLVVAGKTGTSSDFRDSWFAGFSGDRLAVVWVGRDDNRPMGLSGAEGALPVWTELMRGIATNSWDLPLPEDVEDVWVDYNTGLAGTPECGVQAVAVAVPRGVTIEPAPGCGGQTLGGVAQRVIESVREIFR